ncbi:MAG: hypothetical protein KJ914_10080 [Gammaproteobacteria bacterium]|nr:hypothetical protein [Gammaproteobacteria bacterium]MBU1722319.1 hypothetical protein [Gammaproteobacteria bacterium]MBU2006436.1 hypothetical protein [Gammaproteobacteria bacterium]
MTRIGAIILFLLAATNGWANVSDWQDLGSITHNNAASNLQARSTSTNASPLQQYRRMLLNEESLRSSLNQAASSATNAQGRTAITTISLPLPDGSFAAVTATPTQVLAPEIAAQHPEIQTWQVLGTDGKTLSGVIDFTTLGFHAMLDMPNGDTVFIDPQESNGQREYATFSKRNNATAFQQKWTCSTHGKSSFRDLSSIMPDTSSAARNTAAKAGETLHTYRIAIASTAEFTSAKGGKTATHSSIVSTVNRINQIFQRDLSIKLTLVSGENTVFTDTATDGYTNNDPEKMLLENIAVLNTIIGSNAYDIGHVFGTLGGGLAYLGSTCSTYKASGVTGLIASNDAFDIDYVAHEIGHQFDADHTFNSVLGSCGGGRIQASAYEPGSGSTIMGYTGLCNGDDLQANSDAMFHAASIAQITAFAHDGAGKNCATSSPLINSKTASNNRNPVVDAGADFSVTVGQSFTLNGSASDADGDTLSYSWEQMDAGTASTVGVDTGDNALIRANLPLDGPMRIITGTLPSTIRTLNFRLVVRDQQGGVGFDDMRITTVASSDGGGGGGSFPLIWILPGALYLLLRRRKGTYP